MQPKTLTTLGALNVGDRFTFTSSKNEVWQVTKQCSKTHYNKFIDASGIPFYMHDMVGHRSKEVIFLRNVNQ